MTDSLSPIKNVQKYPFARFYYPGEEDIKNNTWLRTIELEKSTKAKIKKIRIALSSDKLIPLSLEKKNKIIYWKNFSINSAEQSIPNIYLLSRRAGWNQTSRDIKKLVNIDPEGCFNAVLNDGKNHISLGSGTVLRVAENLDWIGMILVHPEIRRQGIALEIMKRCITFARLTKKSPVIGLDATPMGFSLYRSLGFKESFRIWRSTIDTGVSHLNYSDILIKKVKSFVQITEYLIEKSISDKSMLLQFVFSLYTNGCFIAIKNNTICGFVFSRPGRLKPFIGHLIADSNEIARALLDKALNYWAEEGFRDVFLDIPECHFFKEAKKVDSVNMYEPPEKCYLADEIKPVRLFFRMYHLIDYEELKTLKMKTGYEKAMQYSALHYIKTTQYIENEKQKLLPFLKCSGGPEMS